MLKIGRNSIEPPQNPTITPPNVFWVRPWCEVPVDS